MPRGTRGVDLDQCRTLMSKCLQHAFAKMYRVGNRRLCHKRIALRECEQPQASSRVVDRRIAQPQVHAAQYQHLDRQAGVQQPDQLAESLSCKHLVAADQHERWADLELLFAQVLPTEACQRFALPVGAIGLVDFEARLA